MLSNYNFSLTFSNILSFTRIFLDIFLLWIAFYYAIKIIKNNSRTSQIFKGILFILFIDAIAKLLGLNTIAWLADIFVNWGFLAIIILFQPELRNLLERLGKSSVFSRIGTLNGNEKENLVNQIVTATELLSKRQTGALISIEQSHSLSDFIATGTPINSDVTAELLTSIFVTTTPLHDGAVIIQGSKIACASAYFPPTNLNLPGKYGARHRAAIGISEISDSITIVVSEETGSVSVTQGGKIFSVNKKQLRDYLMRAILGVETEIKVKPKAGKKVDKSERFDTQVLSKLAIKNQEKKMSEKQEIIDEVKNITLENESVDYKDDIEKPFDTGEVNIDIKLPNRKIEPIINKSIKEKESEVIEKINHKKEEIKEEIIKDIKEEVKEDTDSFKEAKMNSEVSSSEMNYDTTKINISDLVGLNSSDLNEQFEMLDKINISKDVPIKDIEEITVPKGGNK